MGAERILNLAVEIVQVAREIKPALVPSQRELMIAVAVAVVVVAKLLITEFAVRQGCVIRKVTLKASTRWNKNDKRKS